MEKVWLQEYEESIQPDIDPDRTASLVDVFEHAVNEFGPRVAFLNMGHQISFDDLDVLSRQFAAYLQFKGFQKGDSVAIMMPNLLQYPIALFGILRAGLTVVNVNPLYTARELAHQLNDANVKCIVIVENFAATLEQVINKTSVQEVLLTSIGDMFPVPKKWLVNLTIKYVKKMVPSFELPHAISFNSALQIGEASGYVRPEINGSGIAFLQYTGGTTGVSKGAMLTHRNMVANLEQVSGILETSIIPGKDMVVTALPLYHIFALTSNCLTFLKYGCPNLLITNPRDMKDFVSQLSKHQFAVITGVNTLFNGLLNSPGFAEIDFSQFKFGLGGGMAVQRPVAERWQQVTGRPLIEGYGLTECSPVVTVNPTTITEYKGSIGLPLPSTEIKLIGDDGEMVPVGEPGEMYVKGPQVMLGYFNRPKATSDILSDGWLSTGDIARMDERGYFYIVDRKKDMILVSGFNVFPNEIEEVAAMHPSILETAAIGIPHEVSGEVVKLFVVKKDSDLKEAEVIQHCKELLTGYKVPKVVEFRDELPKTNVGKILRRELRA